jgi:hypothetical protein
MSGCDALLPEVQEALLFVENECGDGSPLRLTTSHVLHFTNLTLVL